MYLPLNHPLKLPKCNNALNIKSISTDNDIKQWVGIGSQAFGYDINFQVIQQLRRNSAIHLLLAWLDQTPVACGLLYQTDKVIGIHQVAIAPKYQGQGLAKQLMVEMINRCFELGGNYVVLQASSAGKPLYQKLGFHEQFIIDNYQLV
nr:GNAT family N-acetyltransferase [Thalassotalea sp. G2M2-11]